ncbi:phage tail protein [Sphingomonas soli]|uniref:phage tail protein n=1 Tax=Sphingomonas soli TaxID=266127 RepID=UPI0008366023|nr:phage tail protein [Sphingomonas soli]
MATLVLTVAGGLIGGPVGAAIGSAAGNVIDREVLFKPKGREGPRLSELKLQTSAYGTQIPKLFGTMRVAGSVIWATDLIEHRSTSGGGKGRASTTSYSYTASFAVALSMRPILGIGRIWADGKLLRGAAGDWKARTGFRVHPGSEEQTPDPLIAAAEGAGAAPAHRGIAYAVFEDLELGDFGNRIPSLTFEVTADAGPVEAGAILREIGIGCSEATAALDGFSAHGASVRAVAETLAGASGGWFLSDGGPTLIGGPGAAVALEDKGTRAHAREGAGAKRAIAAADSAPRTLTLTYYDPARDYQAGIQRAARPGAGNREARLELPAAIGANAAKGIAEAALARFDSERERRGVALGWDRLGIRPGERVTIAGAPGLWRVDRWSLEGMVVTLDCVAVSPGARPVAASAGRVLAATDIAIGSTRLHAFELPMLDEPLSSVSRLAIAAAGSAPGWRSAALLTSLDGGARWAEAGGTAAPAVLGTILVPPGDGPAGIEDLQASIVIELAHDAMVLEDASFAALDAGANLAIAGDELIQFGRAESLGDGIWRLTRLWRGRRGSEGAIGTQAGGDRFVLIDADTLAVRDLPLSAIGASALVLAQGAGDGSESAVADALITGVALVPPSPVHFAAAETGEGETQLTWVRRSRSGWRWIDGMDAPMGEEAERYQLRIAPEEGPERFEEVTEASFLLSPADRAAAVTITLRQIGSHGLSPPATLTLSAIGEV